jgi:hypothetical protein
MDEYKPKIDVLTPAAVATGVTVGTVIIRILMAVGALAL